MTIEEIREYAIEGGLNRIQTVDKLKHFADRAATIERAIEEAKRKGNVEDYQRLSAEKEIVSERIIELRSCVSSFPRYSTREDIRAAWNEYASGYNPAFEKKYTAYKKARKALAEQFEELRTMQRQALDDLRTVNGLVSENRRAVQFGILDEGLERVSALETPSFMYKVLYDGVPSCPEAVFFIEAGEISREELNSINKTVLLKE